MKMPKRETEQGGETSAASPLDENHLHRKLVADIPGPGTARLPVRGRRVSSALYGDRWQELNRFQRRAAVDRVRRGPAKHCPIAGKLPFVDDQHCLTVIWQFTGQVRAFGVVALHWPAPCRLPAPKHLTAPSHLPNRSVCVRFFLLQNRYGNPALAASSTRMNFAAIPKIFEILSVYGVNAFTVQHSRTAFRAAP